MCGIYSEKSDKLNNFLDSFKNQWMIYFNNGWLIIPKTIIISNSKFEYVKGFRKKMTF